MHAWQQDLDGVETVEALQALRVKILGKRGSLTGALNALGALPEAERRAEGARLNTERDAFTKAFEAKHADLLLAQAAVNFENERLDLTLPAAPIRQGLLHPLSQVASEVAAIFRNMGFSIDEGPDLETDFYNFDALNIPESHPSRDVSDTFYVEPFANDGGIRRALRSQTSAVQVRALQNRSVPIRCIAFGRVYRPDAEDATHASMFHQFEGLIVEPGVHMGHLKHCIESFMRAWFGVPINLQFVPDFFPFTEPSAGINVQLLDKPDAPWLELGGCGMVHPNVLRNAGIDADQHQGFAFGFGIERFAMLKYGVGDLRLFTENDQRWLQGVGTAFFRG